MASEVGKTVVSQLSERPEARSFSVEDLLREVAKGRVRIPRFQRSLKWEDRDRVALFDSLYRGFPVGTLLLWEKPASADVVQLGRWVSEAPERDDALWVVDGQQRIATLAGTLLADAKPNSGRVLRFDLEQRVFEYGPEVKLRAPRWLPVSELIDSRRLLSWALAEELTHEKDLLDVALDAGKRIREYQIPAYIVETDDTSVLPQIFERTNQSGRRMTKDEVFDALFMAQEGDEGGEPTSLRAIAASKELVGLGFGRVPENLILQAVIAIENLNPSSGAEQFKRMDVQAVRGALLRTQRALTLSIAFLQETAEVPHISVLPYGFPLAGLARFFHLHPEPLANSRKLLSRWLWRGAINREHAWSTTALRRMIEAILPEDEEGSVQRLLQTVARPPAEEDPGLGRFDSSTARSRWQLAALATLRPRSLRPPELFDEAAPHLPLVLGDYFKEDDRPASPAVPLLSAQHLGLHHASEVTSRVLHPAAKPSELREWIVAAEDEALASHAISPASREALRADRMQEFLDLRAVDISAVVERFLGRKAAWAPPDRDRPTIAYVVHQVEGDEDRHEEP